MTPILSISFLIHNHRPSTALVILRPFNLCDAGSKGFHANQIDHHAHRVRKSFLHLFLVRKVQY